MCLSSFRIYKEILYKSCVFSAFRPPRPPEFDFSFLPPSQKHTDFLTEPYQNEAFPAQGPPGPGFEVLGPDFSFWALSQRDTHFLTETYQNEAFPAQGPPGPGLEVRWPDFSFWAIFQKDTDFLTEAYQNEASSALRNSLSHPEAFRPGVSDLHSS